MTSYINPYPGNIFVLKQLCLFLSQLHIFVHFKLDFIMEVNTMNPDQSPYCLQYRVPKNISRREEQTTNVMTGWQRVNTFLLLFDFILYVPVNNLSVIPDGSSWVEPVLSRG